MSTACGNRESCESVSLQFFPTAPQDRLTLRLWMGTLINGDLAVSIFSTWIDFPPVRNLSSRWSLSSTPGTVIARILAANSGFPRRWGIKHNANHVEALASDTHTHTHIQQSGIACTCCSILPLGFLRPQLSLRCWEPLYLERWTLTHVDLEFCFLSYLVGGLDHFLFTQDWK